MNAVLNDNMNESSNKLGRELFPNTELGINLKLMTRKPGRLAVGEYLDGTITRDGEDHFFFHPRQLLQEESEGDTEKSARV